MLEDFDRFCDEHNITPDEVPAAFAAWLNRTTGWDGDMAEVAEHVCCTCHAFETGCCRPWARSLGACQPNGVRCLSGRECADTKAAFGSAAT
jgi:hypothetical protein